MKKNMLWLSLVAALFLVCGLQAQAQVQVTIENLTDCSYNVRIYENFGACGFVSTTNVASPGWGLGPPVTTVWTNPGTADEAISVAQTFPGPLPSTPFIGNVMFGCWAPSFGPYGACQVKIVCVAPSYYVITY